MQLLEGILAKIYRYGSNKNMTLAEGQRKTIRASSISARLFPLFEPKKGVLKKAKPKNAFGKPKTQLFYKSCDLSIEKK